MAEKNFKQLDEELDKIESQIRYMQQLISERNAPEEVKKSARKALPELEKKREKIIKEIQD